MEYDFQRHEPCFDKVLFVLALDRKKMKERIVAGTETAVRSRLRGNPDAEVICDVTRQLGTFLIEFEQDPDGEWNRLGLAPLREALHTNRWKQPELEKTEVPSRRSGTAVCSFPHMGRLSCGKGIPEPQRRM